MDRIESAVEITLSKYPGIGKDDLVRLFTDYIETHLPDIVARVKLPSRMELKREWFLERRKTKEFRMSEEELREREAFVKWLERIKSKNRERPIDADFVIEMDGWSRNNVMQLMEHPFASSEIEIDGEIYSKDFEDGLQSLGDHTLLGAIPEVERAVSIEKMRVERLDEVVELISERAREVSQNRVEKISHYYDADFGFTIEVVVNQTDKEAFETWLQLIDELKSLGFDVLVTVDWTGGNMLSEDELVHKMVDVMLKSGVGPKRTDRFSAVKELKEGWM
ncbi:MAG: hypothetical protein EFT35_01165 [Methanophagales archaeon ANME-1-THS]|nr:MAG: hypothetical protein EFT35_01165 [Methanophagales archaeon ANME-1-THS]